MDLRKLDALVAEKIMGWTKNTTLDYVPIYYPPGPAEMNALGHVIPLFTTDAKAANEVLERMQRGFRDEMIDALPALGANPKEQGTNDKIVSENVSPLEICLAALKIKGIDISEWET